MSAGISRIAGRCIDAVAALLRISIVLAMGIMLFCIFYQVVMRYVFSNSPPWSEEMALLMFSWTTLGGLALGVYEGFHVRLDMIVKSLPTILGDQAERLINIATALFGAYLAWSGWRFVDVTSGSVSAAIGYPIEMLHSLAPVSGALIFLFAAWRAVAGAPLDEATDLAP
jgi:TRAP-type C4-dicarboxylate transport system permease small subunit